MSDEPSMRDRRPTLERHIQTILTALVIAAITWVGVSITAMREQAAALNERVVYLTQAVDRMEQRLAGSLSAPELQRAFEIRDQRIDDHETRLRVIERKGG